METKTLPQHFDSNMNIKKQAATLIDQIDQDLFNKAKENKQLKL
jgi:hypothetical protein